MDNDLEQEVVPGDMLEPGELAAFDDCQQRILLACVGGDLLSDIVICLVPSL